MYTNYTSSHTGTPPNCHGYFSIPSHVTHSWQSPMGIDPFAALAASMNRLAAAIEKHNELSEKAKEVR
jgi:hypothetical protein